MLISDLFLSFSQPLTEHLLLWLGLNLSLVQPLIKSTSAKHKLKFTSSGTRLWRNLSRKRSASHGLVPAGVYFKHFHCCYFLWTWCTPPNLCKLEHWELNHWNLFAFTAFIACVLISGLCTIFCKRASEGLMHLSKCAIVCEGSGQ